MYSLTIHVQRITMEGSQIAISHKIISSSPIESSQTHSWNKILKFKIELYSWISHAQSFILKSIYPKAACRCCFYLNYVDSVVSNLIIWLSCWALFNGLEIIAKEKLELLDGKLLPVLGASLEIILPYIRKGGGGCKLGLVR